MRGTESRTDFDDSPRNLRVHRISHFFVLLAGVVFGATMLDMKNVALPSPTNNSIKEKVIVGISENHSHEQELPYHSSGTKPSYREIHEWTFPDTNVNSDGYLYRNRSQMFYEFNSTVQFIFTVGLEGTGHHLMGSIASQSPAIRRLKKLDIWSKVGALQARLFNQQHLSGLWNAHCAPKMPVSEIEEDLVKRLRGIEAHANQMLAQQQQNGTSVATRTTLPLPLNTVHANGAGRYGEVSYPNFLGACRPLNYPDLNLLYNACHKAQVDCSQVYLYRHPLEILNSIVRRGYDNSESSTMQMYIADLHVMANQIRMYSSKTLGCFNFFSEDPNDMYWLEAQRDLWAWSNAGKYKTFMDSVYRKPEHSEYTNEERFHQLLDESPHSPYLKSWWDAHQQVIQLCRQAAKGGHLE
jgi:hypothetical protein